jgi:hypothetical protein
MGSEATRGKATVTGGDVVVYQEKDGRVRLEVRLEGETVWLSLTQMAELFGRDKSVISRHLHTVFATGELKRAATVAENATVQREGGRAVTRQVEYFNLDAILSVGYRVNSKRGTQFRIWATRTLREHVLRGYTLDERRLRLASARAANSTLLASVGRRILVSARVMPADADKPSVADAALCEPSASCFSRAHSDLGSSRWETLQAGRVVNRGVVRWQEGRENGSGSGDDQGAQGRIQGS